MEQKTYLNINKYKQILQKKIEGANVVIEKYLPVSDGYLSELFEAMAYSVNAGGKRIRPILIEISYRMCGGKGSLHEPFMAAMEYLHTYSLVHDDLPAIDNDDYRRGKLTTHKKFGEACGVLAGDGLLHLSYETAIKAFDMAEGNVANVIRALKIFGDKTGECGMLGGQSVDVLFTGKNPDKDRLDFVYRLKTCALIEGSLMIGAALAGADEKVIMDFEKAGRNIGMAFQIRDDILDYTSTFEELGKPIGSDERNNKTTYVSLFGIENAQMEVEKLSSEAIGIFEKYSIDMNYKNKGTQADDRSVYMSEECRFLCQFIKNMENRNK